MSKVFGREHARNGSGSGAASADRRQPRSQDASRNASRRDCVGIRARFLCLLATMVLAASAGSAQSKWKLVWSDEFSGPKNAAPDPTKWTFDLGANGWGNRELEEYRNSVENSFQDGEGNLVIRAQRTPSGGYTSARLKTKRIFSFTYGKVEARIRLPRGQGIWPAFWMLGADIDTVSWPACGEIDVMENIGREPSIVHATVHGPGYSGDKGITAAYELPNGKKLSDDFHTFSAEWTADAIEFFIDGQTYSKVTPASLPSGATWVFNKPFFLVMNLAVGGNWPGPPDASTTFPQSMVVDYVRVYAAETSASIGRKP
jgi:beta-glucanase (GH16 family)